MNRERFKAASRRRSQDFPRHRVLTVAGLLARQINRSSKSLSVEVSRFVERFFGPGLDYSKQAYSQCRARLQPQAYRALNGQFVSASYQEGP